MGSVNIPALEGFALEILKLSLKHDRLCDYVADIPPFTLPDYGGNVSAPFFKLEAIYDYYRNESESIADNLFATLNELTATIKGSHAMYAILEIMEYQMVAETEKRAPFTLDMKKLLLNLRQNFIENAELYHSQQYQNIDFLKKIEHYDQYFSKQYHIAIIKNSVVSSSKTKRKKTKDDKKHRLGRILLLIIPWIVFAATVAGSFWLMSSDISANTADVIINVLRVIRVLSLIVGVLFIFGYRKTKDDPIQKNPSKSTTESIPAAEKEPVPAPDKDEVITALRQAIAEEISARPATEYTLAIMMGKEAADCFPDAPFWEYIRFCLDLTSHRIYMYLEASGTRYYKSSRLLKSEEFHSIAVQHRKTFDFSVFKTDNDWDAVFDDELCAAIDEAKKRLASSREKQ